MGCLGGFALCILLAVVTALPAQHLPHEYQYGPDYREASSSKVVPYQCFDGILKRHPVPQQWLPIDQLWKINQPFILSRNGGDTYVEHYIREAVHAASIEHHIDERFILAAIMQASGGRATAACFGPSMASCHVLHDPFRPKTSIEKMVNAGLDGISANDCWMSYPGLSRHASSCYAPAFWSDMGNRLLGWDGRGPGAKQCRFDGEDEWTYQDSWELRGERDEHRDL